MSTARLSDKEQWELFIPEMGYMALLRNLRNFDDSGVDASITEAIGEKLSSPDEVAKSRQFPYAFHAAWLNVPSARWKKYLDKALDLSVPNIPELDGRNLILIDTSGSMSAEMSPPAGRRRNQRPSVDPATGTWRNAGPESPTRMAAAAIFGIALGIRNKGKVDLWSFASGQEDLTALANPPAGEGVLSSMDIFLSREGRVGHGTDIAAAIQNTYKGHDRVFVFTDMQSMPIEGQANSSRDVTHAVPEDKHVYGFNLAGYTNTPVNTGTYRHEMGGLTDATFSLVKNVEAGVAGVYPWE